LANTIGLRLDDSDATGYIYRNIVYGYTNGLWFANGAAGSAVLCNTCYYNGGENADGNLECTSATALIQNNAAFVVPAGGSPGADIIDTTGVLDYNGTSDGSGDDEGTNGIANLVTADQFVDPTDTWADTDLLLKAGSDLIGEGLDLSGDVGTYPEIDVSIDKGASRDTIAGAWDIGASQLDAGAENFEILPNPVTGAAAVPAPASLIYGIELKNNQTTAAAAVPALKNITMTIVPSPVSLVASVGGVGAMATGSATWRATIDTSWIEDGNYLENRHPVDGDTFTADGGEVGFPALPNANLPGAGTIGFTFTGAYATVVTVEDMLNGASIGLVTVNDGLANIAAGAHFAGATITDGYLHIDGAYTSSQNISAAVGTLTLSNATLSMADGKGVDLDGGFLQGLGGAPALDGILTVGGGDGSVDWADGALDIIGSFDANGNSVNHTNMATGNSLTCDIIGYLDLGSDAAALDNLDVEIQAATMTRVCCLRCGSWKMTAGSYNDGGLDHTIAGDILDEGGTLTSTGEWTMTGTGDIAGGTFHHLTLAAAGETTTTSGVVVCEELTLGAGEFTGTDRVDLKLVANDKLIQHADNVLSLSNAVGLRIWASAATYEIGALDTTGGATLTIFGNDFGIKITGTLNAAGSDIRISGISNGDTGTLDANDQDALAHNITVGNVANDTRFGEYKMGAGTTTVTGAIQGGDAGNKAGNKFNFGTGTLVLTGTFDGTNIGTITASAGATITGGGTIQNCGDPGIVMDCRTMKDGGHNHANWRFTPRTGASSTSTSTSSWGR